MGLQDTIRIIRIIDFNRDGRMEYGRNLTVHAFNHLLKLSRIDFPKTSEFRNDPPMATRKNFDGARGEA
ncbi:hypothetical protein OUZ56_013069 [Daphnia magna]|uniref:EF-hand domain-containing protein n=1 Tax=Daphnia magna TaxID=35525 RepID=A0ABQ9Z4S8_9CRUS|nr:hypothetical protein OUZ56_013069 [Daphnia magna]